MPHFTVTSSIAASFTFETNAGITGTIFEGPNSANDFLALTLELRRAAESLLFSIVPISGQEFTERILRPINEDVLAFFMFQGVRIELLARLMGDAFETLTRTAGRSASITIRLPPPDDYRTFRQIALHWGGCSKPASCSSTS